MKNDKAKIITDGNGYCDLECPFFERKKDEEYCIDAKCKYMDEYIIFHDWFIAICQIDNQPQK